MFWPGGTKWTACLEIKSFFVDRSEFCIRVVWIGGQSLLQIFKISSQKGYHFMFLCYDFLHCSSTWSTIRLQDICDEWMNIHIILLGPGNANVMLLLNSPHIWLSRWPFNGLKQLLCKNIRFILFLFSYSTSCMHLWKYYIVSAHCSEKL